MTMTHDQPPACARLERILAAEAEGQKVGDKDRAFLTDHAGRCPDCGPVLRALELLALDESEGPVPPLDELRRRRMVREVLASAGSPPAARAAEGRGAAGRPRLKKAAGMVGLAAALAAAAVTAVLFGPGVVTRGVHEEALAPLPRPGATRPAGPPAPPTRLLLRAGDVLLDGRSAVVGQPIHKGQTVRVNRGRAVLELPLGSKVVTGPGSTVVMDQLSPDRVQLRLQQGELLASVTRRREGQVFVVVTRAGRVTVRGTLFLLKVRPAGPVELQVLQGLVQVAVPGLAPVRVDGGQATVLGDPGLVPSPLPAPVIQALMEQAQVLALVGNGPQGARASVVSRPVGATVLVDGTPVGETPVVAALRSGQRSLTVRSEGLPPEQEEVKLEGGDVVLRDLDLGRAVAQAPLPGPDQEGPGQEGAAREEAAREERPRAEASAALQVQGLQQKVNTLKEKVHISKLRLQGMKAIVLDGDLGVGCRLTIRHINRMGRMFRLVRLAYAMDGVEIFTGADTSAALDGRQELVVLDRSVPPGPHTLSVHLVFYGRGLVLFPYFEGFRFDVRSSHTFIAGSGRHTLVGVTAKEKDDRITTPIKDLPSIHFDVKHLPLGGR